MGPAHTVFGREGCPARKPGCFEGPGNLRPVAAGPEDRAHKIVFLVAIYLPSRDLGLGG